MMVIFFYLMPCDVLFSNTMRDIDFWTFLSITISAIFYPNHQDRLLASQSDALIVAPHRDFIQPNPIQPTYSSEGGEAFII